MSSTVKRPEFQDRTIQVYFLGEKMAIAGQFKKKPGVQVGSMRAKTLGGMKNRKEGVMLWRTAGGQWKKTREEKDTTKNRSLNGEKDSAAPNSREFLKNGRITLGTKCAPMTAKEASIWGKATWASI